MELGSEEVKTLTPLKSIHEVIPNEILEQILKKLPSRDLLRCRTVCNLWKSIASAICRQRYINANLRLLFNYPNKIQDFYEIFENSNDLPWSACTLQPLKRGSPSMDYVTVDGVEVPEYFITLKQLKRFVDTFGPHLLKVQLMGDNIDWIKMALMGMPNLEVLISRIDPTAKDMRRICSGNRLQMDKLKHLQIFVPSMAEIKLLQFLHESAPRLDSISVEFKDNHYEDVITKYKQADLTQTAALISRIASIKLEFLNSGPAHARLFQTLTIPALKIKELELKVSLKNAIDDNYIRAMEQMLAGNSNWLERLDMRCGSVDGKRLASRLQMPVFSKLKKINLSWHLVSNDTPTFFEPFKSNQFPVLNEVTLNVVGPENNEQMAKVFGKEKFTSVQEFNINNWGANKFNLMTLDWGQIFPNLGSLSLCGGTVEAYSYIFQKMTKLEHLRLVVVLAPFLGDLPFSGYPKDPKENPDESPETSDESPENSDETPENSDETPETPSLGSLTNLKSLILNFGYCYQKEDSPCPDSEVHLALLKLQKLDSLTFESIIISEEVKTKLGAYHNNLKVNGVMHNCT